MNDAGENREGLAAHDWAGQAGMRWLAQLDRFESMIEPIGRALLAQAAYNFGETVVDVGCGGGWTTRQIATAVGNTGFVLGLDISPDLVGMARERAQRAGLANIRFEQGDAATAMLPTGGPGRRRGGAGARCCRRCRGRAAWHATRGVGAAARVATPPGDLRTRRRHARRRGLTMRYGTYR